MARYTTQPTARGYIETPLYQDDKKPLVPNCTVAEHLAHDTGLLNANGEKIYREPRPIGFGRHDQW